MSDTPQNRERPLPELDISTPGKAPTVRTRSVLVWAGFLVGVILAYVFDWPYWFIAIGLLAGALVGFVDWFVRVQIIRRGRFTWMRLAKAPAEAMARGDANAAEAAYVKALARARRFAADDTRRAVMLNELGNYAKHQGRCAEVLALLEENVAILTPHLGDHPLDYFVALNNLAIYHIHLKHHDAAQDILERVLDLIIQTKKSEANGGIVIQPNFLRPIQVLVHLNVAFLLIEMKAWTAADEHLQAVGALLPLLPRKARAKYADHYVGTRALLHYESGQFAEAEAVLATAPNPDYSLCGRVCAGLCRVRGEFAEAERLLRLYQAAVRKKGTLHRPEMLKATLEFAECLFGQGKHDEAFESLHEVRLLVADFAPPADAAWKNTLQSWLARAKELGRAEIAAALEAELERMPADANQAITILEKLRISRVPD